MVDQLAFDFDVQRIPECEGYSAAEPIDEEDLREVFWYLRYNTAQRKYHDRNGWLADIAGEGACTHDPDDDGIYDEDTHSYGWTGDQLCDATKYGTACTECEAEIGDCEPQRDVVQPDTFWELFGAGFRTISSESGSQ